MATATLLRRAAIVALATSILAAAVPALAATTFTTTSITTDNFTANGTVSFSDADADTITIGQNGATPDTVTINGIGNLNLNNTGNNLTLASGGVSMNGNITLTDSQWGVTSAGAATFSGLLVQPLTATDDTLTFVMSGGASSFAGTITAADLTAARTWTFPDAGGNVVIDSATQTLANKTLSGPRITTSIFDSSGNEMIDLGVVASAVNQLLVNNAATTGNPLLGVNGDDANIGLTLQTKGAGDLDIQTNTATTDVIRFRPATGAARFTGTVTSADLTANRVWTLPNVSGTLALLTDVTGASGWSDGGANVALVTTNDQVGIGTTTATAKLDVVPHSNALVGLLVKGAASQSADLLQMRDDAGTVLARFTSNGDLRLRGNGGTAVIETDSTTTVDLFNGVPTTVNFAGAATALNIGASTGTTLVRNDLATNGTTLTLDADNASTGATVQIIANQGSENDGIIRYNTTTNSWEFSNDGTTFSALAGGSALSGSGASGGVTFWTGASAVSADASNFFWDNINKALGIGTNNPTSALAVADETGATTNAVNLLQLDHMTTGTAGTGFGTGIMFRAEDAGGNADDLATVQAVYTDAANGSEDTELRFFTRSAGGSLAEALVVGQTGDLKVAGSAVLNGTTLTLDADNTGAGATLQIIANQGAESDGTIRYNTTTNAWELSNDGGAFAAIASGSSLTGTGSAGQVAFFNGATSVTGESQLFWDSTNKRLGVGTNGQTSTLYVQPAANAGNTGLNTGWFQVASGTYTDNVTAASGTAAAFAFNAFHQPTLAASNATVSTTNAATVYIAGAPANGSNMSILNSWALWAASGKARFDGDLYANGNVTLGDGSGDTLNLNAGTVTLAASVNVDSNTLVIDPSTNRIGLGTASPETRLHVSDGIAPNAALIAGGEQIMVSSSNAQAIQRFITAGNVDQHQTIIRAVRARGTLDTPTAPAQDDRVLSLQGLVFDTGASQITAEVRFSVDGTVASSIAPQRIGFFTSASDFAGLTERLRIGSGGAVQVFGTLAVGTGGTAIVKHLSQSFANVVSAGVAAQSCADYATLTLAGTAVGDTVTATPTPLGANGVEDFSLSWSAYVSAADTIVIRACNPTSSSIDTSDTQTWRIDVWRH